MIQRCLLLFKRPLLLRDIYSLTMPTILDAIAKNERSVVVSHDTATRLVLAKVVDVDQVEGVDVARKVAEDREQDVDEEVWGAAADDEDADRRD